MPMHADTPTPTPDEIAAVRARLRELGYEARIANRDCFDVQDRVSGEHYLAWEEALALAASAGPHPLNLLAHSRPMSTLNRAYTFPPPASPAQTEAA